MNETMCCQNVFENVGGGLCYIKGLSAADHGWREATGRLSLVDAGLIKMAECRLLYTITKSALKYAPCLIFVRCNCTIHT